MFGGRGRGRGGPVRGAQALVRDTAMDIGLDARTLGAENGERELYPDIGELPPAPVLSEEDQVPVNRQQELVALMNKSPYYIAQQNLVNDVERYSDYMARTAEGSTQRSQANFFITSKDNAIYIPEELLSGRKMKQVSEVSTKSAAKGDTTSHLGELEAKEKEGLAPGEEKDKEEDQVSDVEADVEEDGEIGDDDYGVNHYDSGGESDGDDDEPII